MTDTAATARDEARIETETVAACPGEVLGRVDLGLAIDVRLVRLDLDPVLCREVLDHLAVVRPVGRGGDEVHLSLGLPGGTDGVDAAHIGGRGRGLGVAGRARSSS